MLRTRAARAPLDVPDERRAGARAVALPELVAVNAVVGHEEEGPPNACPIERN